MSKVPDSDREVLLQCRERFKTLAAGPGLYHVMRVPVNPVESDPVELERSWSEFLGDEKPFEFFRHRLPGIHEGCFYGAKERLRDFVGPAVQAFDLAPGDVFPPLTSIRDVRVQRDGWLIGLHRLGAIEEHGILIDFRGGGPYGKSKIHYYAGDLLRRLARKPSDVTQEIENWLRWRREFDQAIPTHVYSGLAHNVFDSSVRACEYILERRDQPSEGLPGDICDVLPDEGDLPRTRLLKHARELGIDPVTENRTVRREGFPHEVQLTKLQHKLFSMLLSNFGHVCPHEILANAWPDGAQPKKGNNKVYVEINRLNTELGRLGLVAENVPREGYLLKTLSGTSASDGD